MSLKARLTLLTAATVVVAVAVFTVVAITRTRDVLQRRSAAELTVLANGMVRPARVQVKRVDDGRRPLQYRAEDDIDMADVNAGYAIVVTASGDELPLPRIGPATEAVPPLPSDLRDRAGEAPFRLKGADGEEYLAVVLAVPDSDAVVFVAVGDSRTAASIDELVRTFEVTGVVLVLVFIGLSVIAVHVGLRPLRAVTTTARRIALGSRSERVATTGSGTEIDELGSSFNDALDALDAATAEMEGANRRTQRFAADAAHELRTPVTTILGYAELHQRGAIEGRERLDAVFDRIHHEATRLRELVEGLLLLDRIEARTSGAHGEPAAAVGHDAPQATVADLGELCAEAASDSMAIDPEHPVEVLVDAPTSSDHRSGRVVLAALEPDRAFQVIANLLANVRAHTPPGTPTTITFPSPPAGRVVVEVVDRGPGIVPEHRAKVFDRFFRSDPARGRSVASGGSGLGLAIVAALVQEAGGTVALGDPPGGGTAVRVELPAAQASGPKEGSTVQRHRGTSTLSGPA